MNTMQPKLKSMGLAVLGAGLLTALASAQGSITTTFAGGNGRSDNGAGNMFDVDVKNTNGLKITSFDVNSSDATKATIVVDVYITPTTYVGNDTNRNVWVKVATGRSTTKGRNTPTPVDTSDFLLAPGKYGMYLIYTSPTSSVRPGPSYTNGNGSNQKYSNKDIALALGIARSAPWGGSVFNPRVWNGTIYYAANDKAASGAHGFGCPGTNSKSPLLSLSADPVIGTTVKLNVTDMIKTISGGGLMFIGFKRVQQDLTPIGMPKCALFNEALVILKFVNRNGSWSITAPIPNDKALVGAIVHAQAANPDKGANPLGLAASNGLSIRIGNK